MEEQGGRMLASMITARREKLEVECPVASRSLALVRQLPLERSSAMATGRREPAGLIATGPWLP
jgi:hypothetical protein